MYTSMTIKFDSFEGASVSFCEWSDVFANVILVLKA